MNLIFSITELSNLTGKSRPSLYKYINAFEMKDYDQIPYSFVKLFELMNKPNVSKNEIINYCELTFNGVSDDTKINEIFKLIKNNKDKLNLKKLKIFIEGEIKNE